MRNHRGAGGARRAGRAAAAALGLVVLGVAGCQADRQTFEQTDATLDAPPQVEAAPAAPFSSEAAARGTADTLSPRTADTLPRDTGMMRATDTLPRP